MARAFPGRRVLAGALLLWAVSAVAAATVWVATTRLQATPVVAAQVRPTPTPVRTLRLGQAAVVVAPFRATTAVERQWLEVLEPWGSVTVVSLSPYSTRATREILSAGHSFFVAAVRVCAGSRRALGDGFAAPWTGVTTTGRVIPASEGNAESPGMESLAPLDAGRCADGFVTFEVDTGTRLRSIVYDGVGWVEYRWLVASRRAH
jgi:hypothetical protein